MGLYWGEWSKHNGINKWVNFTLSVMIDLHMRKREGFIVWDQHWMIGRGGGTQMNNRVEVNKWPL